MTESTGRSLSSVKSLATKKRSPSLHGKSANAKILKEPKGLAAANSASEEDETDTKKESKVFGVSVLKAINATKPDLDVPLIVHDTVTWLLEHEWTLQQVVRASDDSDTEKIQKLARLYDYHRAPSIPTSTDPKIVFGLLQRYLESLPEPLLTSRLYYDFIFPSSTLQSLLDKLPQENKSILLRILHLFKKIRSEFEPYQLEQIAKIFRPYLLKFTVFSDPASSRDLLVATSLIQYMIQEPDSFIACISDPARPNLLPGEYIVCRFYRVVWADILLTGTLWITNFRVHFEFSPHPDERSISPEDSFGPWKSWFPLTSIQKFDSMGQIMSPPNQKMKSVTVRVYCKDFQTRTFEFDTSSDVTLFRNVVQQHAFKISLRQLFAFTAFRHESPPHKAEGWDVYSFEKEFERLGLLNSTDRWRITTINQSHKLIPTYPQSLIVPAQVTDDEIKKYSKCRMRRRFPVVVWKHPRGESLIVRADEPDLTSFDTSTTDAIQKKADDVTFLEAYTTRGVLIVFDPGEQKTYEHCYPNLQVNFLRLADNTTTRELFNKLQYMPFMGTSGFFKNRSPYAPNTRWLDYIRAIIFAAQKIVTALESDSVVVIHHSFNNDNDFTLSALCQLMLDGYYRTLKGFQILIEKEWLSYGYPFRRALGHLQMNPDAEQAPTFLQFIECVWQLMNQFPRHFQFNENFLIYILDSMYSCEFGTFLGNSDAEREVLKTNTKSIWNVVNQNPVEYTNVFYVESTRDSLIEPSKKEENYRVWNEYYLRYNHRTKKALKKISRRQLSEKEITCLEFSGAELFYVPREVIRFTNLQELNLQSNQLNRTPLRLLQLKFLRVLNLSHNPLINIEKEYLKVVASRLVCLQDINLNFAKLDEIPSSISKLKSLRILRMRNNNIAELPSGMEKLSNLEIFDIRYNKLTTIPKGFGRLQQLRLLGLGNNAITVIPSDFHLLTSLEILDLCSNKLTELPTFLSEMSSLAVLFLGQNNLGSLPSALGNLSKLRELHLPECTLTAIPSEFYKLTSLRKWVLSRNRLTTLPKSLASLTGLEELSLDQNALALVPECIPSMVSLKELILDSNRITEIPPEIAQLTALVKFSANDNKIFTLANVPGMGQWSNIRILSLKNNGLTSLPATLGILSDTLQQLELEGNKLIEPPPEVVSLGKDAILKHLHDMLDGTQECFRMKLMLVGQENVGKTSLLNALKKKRKNLGPVAKITKQTAPLSTDGIDIETWQLPIFIPRLKRKEVVTLSVWDFAGQEIYYTTHQFFLSARALYLVVWNIQEDEELSKIEFWLQSVKSRVSSAPIIIVGTHLDLVPKDMNVKAFLARLQSKYKKRFPNIKFVTAVSTLTGKGISGLRAEIEQIVGRQPHMGEQLPQSYRLLEELVEGERKKRVPPTISWNEFAQLAASCNIREEASLKRATRFLHETGTLIYFEEEETLNKMVILDPQYLTKFMSSIITTKHTFAKDGILHHIHLKQIWKPPSYPEYLHRHFLALLEKFEISFNLTAAKLRRKRARDAAKTSPTGSLNAKDTTMKDTKDPEANRDWFENGKSLIPALLPEKRPPEMDLLWPRFVDGPQYGRRYTFSFIPQGFFSRLMVRLLHFCETNVYWRNGMLIQSADQKETLLVEISPGTKVLDVAVRAASEVALYRDVVATIETLIRLFKINVTVTVPCIHCLAEKSFNPYYFPLDVCEEAAIKGSFVYCQNVRPIRIQNLVPDLSMMSFEGKKIEFSEIELQDKIGEGGAAIVFKGKWHGPVAVKKLKVNKDEILGGAVDDDTISKAFAEFRREVWIMSSLSHPCIVQLKGLVMDPLCIVTEYLPGGNLYDFIHDRKFESNDDKEQRTFADTDSDKSKSAASPRSDAQISTKENSENMPFKNELSWPLRIKIALDVASGLEFLHSSCPPIIHRDLKSPNILLVHKRPEERENAPIVAKVTDFGLSGLAPTLAGRDVDNPVWLAPEVLKEEEYTEKADIYSYGVILWELLTRKQYFGEYKFLSEIEEKIIAGQRPEIPDTKECQMVPEYIDLVRECWDGDPTKRPTFETICRRLKNIRDKYFPNVVLPPPPTVDRSKENIAEIIEHGGTIVSSTPQLRTETSENTLEAHISSQFLGRLDSATQLESGVLAFAKVESLTSASDHSNSSGPNIEIWVGTVDGTIGVWNSKGVFQRKFKAHSSRIHALLAHEKYVWSCSADGKIIVWPLHPKEKVYTFLLDEQEEALCLTEFMNSYIVAGTTLGKLRIYKSRALKLKKEIKLPKEFTQVSALCEVPAREPKEPSTLWVGTDRYIARLSGNKFKLVDIWEAHLSSVNCILPVGQNQVWSCGTDCVIKAWDSESRSCLRVLDGHTDPVLQMISLPPNVWSCSADKSILVWDQNEYELVNELTFEHTDSIQALIVVTEKQEGKDVPIVWSGALDKQICLWADIDKIYLFGSSALERV
jgi:small GTP-binding protein